VFSTFIIALREGLEASLIVGILLAYLHKTQRKHLRVSLWLGVSIAIALSLALGAFLTYTSHELPAHGEEVFAGTLAVVAVGLVTWMVFWMKRTARNMRTELEGKVSQAAHLGALAMVATAFVAVAREGLETALFIYTNFATVKTSRGPFIGLVLGLCAAMALGFLIYRRTVSINLGKFFKVTGIALIVVAAGVLANGVGDLQTAGWIPGAGAHLWNIESWLAPDSLIASALAGSIGFSSIMTWLQVAVWASYITSVLTFFLMTGAPKRAPRKVSQ
jgi:high-affinity iron transporter